MTDDTTGPDGPTPIEPTPALPPDPGEVHDVDADLAARLQVDRAPDDVRGRHLDLALAAYDESLAGSAPEATPPGPRPAPVSLESRRRRRSADPGSGFKVFAAAAALLVVVGLGARVIADTTATRSDDSVSSAESTDASSDAARGASEASGTDQSGLPESGADRVPEAAMASPAESSAGTKATDGFQSTEAVTDLGSFTDLTALRTALATLELATIGSTTTDYGDGSPLPDQTTVVPDQPVDGSTPCPDAAPGTTVAYRATIAGEPVLVLRRPPDADPVTGSDAGPGGFEVVSLADCSVLTR